MNLLIFLSLFFSSIFFHESLLFCSANGSSSVFEQFLDISTHEEIFDPLSGVKLIMEITRHPDQSVEEDETLLRYVTFLFQILTEDGSYKKITYDNNAYVHHLVQFEKNIEVFDTFAARVYRYYKKNLQLAVGFSDLKCIFAGRKYGWLFCKDGRCYTKDEIQLHYYIVPEFNSSIRTWNHIFASYECKEVIDLQWYLQMLLFDNFIDYSVTAEWIHVKKAIKQICGYSDTKIILDGFKKALQARIDDIVLQQEHPCWYNRQSLKKLKYHTKDGCLGLGIVLAFGGVITALQKKESLAKDSCKFGLKAGCVSGLAMIAAVSGYYGYQTLTKDPNCDNKNLEFYKQLLNFVNSLG